MNFDNIHRSLVDMFNLGESQLKTSLYDFRHQPLDINKYNTFFEYVNKNGLNCHSTIVYLCTHHADANDNQMMILKKNKETPAISPSSPSVPNSLNPQQNISILAEATSSTTSIEIKYEDESNQEHTY
ncbi:unnamed protein product, partial [Rotaria sp. Silwood2]